MIKVTLLINTYKEGIGLHYDADTDHATLGEKQKLDMILKAIGEASAKEAQRLAIKGLGPSYAGQSALKDFYDGQVPDSVKPIPGSSTEGN